MILLQCQERFKCTAHLEATKLLQLSNVSNFIKTEHFPTLLLENCVKAYPMLDQEKLKGRTDAVVLLARLAPQLQTLGFAAFFVFRPAKTRCIS